MNEIIPLRSGADEPSIARLLDHAERRLGDLARETHSIVVDLRADLCGEAARDAAANLELALSVERVIGGLIAQVQTLRSVMGLDESVVGQVEALNAILDGAETEVVRLSDRTRRSDADQV